MDFKSKKDKINTTKQEVKWLFGYIKKYSWEIVFFSITGIIGTFLGLGGSVIVKYMIDAVTGYDAIGLNVLIIGLLGMGVGSIILNAFTNRISTIISTKIFNEIQYDVYKRLVNAEWISLSAYRTGDLLNRLSSDVKTISDSVCGMISAVITRSANFIGSVLIILYYDRLMGIIALICTPISVLVSKVLIKKTKEYNLKLKNINSKIMSFQEETFKNIQIIKSFGITENFENEMNDNQNEYKDSILELNKISILTTSALSLSGMLVSYVCLGFSIYRLWQGAIIFGTFTLFAQLTSKVIVSFSSLVSLIPQVINATTSAGRIMALYEMNQENEDEQLIEDIDVSSMGIRFKNVSFGYNKEQMVINNVSAEFYSGQKIAIVGPSGKGKTTLIRMLLALVKLDQGKIELFDKKGNSIEVSVATRKLFSYVPQGNTVFAKSVAENLKMIKPNATEDEIISVLKKACAYEFVCDMEKGIHTVIGENGVGLSEGQAQRIAIARALLKDSTIMILDEATSALDVDTESKIIKNIIECGKL